MAPRLASAAALLLLPARVTSLHLQPASPADVVVLAAENTSSARVVSQLKNYGDVQYTASVSVGGQDMDAVVDTGSFDLIVFSAECGQACGNKNQLYDENKSKTFLAGELSTTQTFGSGNTESLESWETVSVGTTVEAKKQVFWKAYHSDMSITRDGTFQAILGVGPPESSVLLAKWAFDKARGYGYMARRVRHQRAFRIQKTGSEGSGVDYYEQLYEHAKQESSFVERAGVRVMSICIDKASHSGGTFIWNDVAPEQRPAGTFMSVANVGDLYWSARLSNVKIGDESIGCKDDKCSGIVDTGTSLISVPWAVGRYVDKLVEKLGDCSDLTSLPNLEFDLGGKHISLPPESYVGEVENWWSLKAEMMELMPQLQDLSAKRETSNQTGRVCKSLLMTSDSVGPNGAEWIIGLPLFRKYYTTFVFNEDYTAKSMHFSEADASCQPTSGENLRAEAIGGSRKANMLRVDAAKLRAPKWAVDSAKEVSQLHAQRGGH